MARRNLIRRYLRKEIPLPYIGDNVTIGRGTSVKKTPCYIGDNCKIGNNVKIGFGSYIDKNCVIGDHSTIGQYTVLFPNTTIGSETHIGAMCTSQGNNKIGNFVRINNQCQIGWGMIIEDKVFIGPWFVPSNTKNIIYGRSKIPIHTDPSRIRFGARIGSGVTILPNVTIGREAFIGAGSIVTKSIPDFKVAYGNPARVVSDVKIEERLPEKMFLDFVKNSSKNYLALPFKSRFLRAVKTVLGSLVST